MPELPEVEIVRQSLDKKIKQKKVKKVIVRNRNLRSKIPKNFEILLKNKNIENISRFSKYIILTLDNYNYCLIHLGMSRTLHLIDYKKKEVYYKNLVSLLKKIQKTFKKKVIICLHPKAEYHHFENFKLLQKNFKTVYYKTEYYISKSFLILNAISSTMNYAIIQNKPVFIIKSRHFANVANDKIKNIKKILYILVIL